MEINYLIQNLESLLIKYSNNKSQVEENLHELISGLEVKSINSEIETFADFLVLASSLFEMKAKRLLPQDDEIEWIDEVQIIKLVKQIEKQIEVIAVFFHTDEETIFLETALYKVKSKSLFEERQIQNIIKESRANMVTVKPDFFVIEKTGWREETEDLYNKLKPYGLLQFVRSGRISVSKNTMEISKFLKTQ